MSENILDWSNRAFLERFLAGNPLLAFDYDGTLAPLSVNRHRTPMRTRTRELLTLVARQRKCAVISGRALEDISAILEGIPITAIVGNHGLEPSENEADFLRRARSWIPLLSNSLSRLDGVELEDKGLSLSVHYRRAHDRHSAQRAIMGVARSMSGSMRVVPGHDVVNFIPTGAPEKSDALRDLMESLETLTAVFVGDDLTDEDVFARLSSESVLTIRVGRSQTSRAQYFLQSQDEIDALLELATGQSAIA